MIDLEPLIESVRHDLMPFLGGVEDFLKRLDKPDGFPATPLRSQPLDAYIHNILAIGILNRLNRPAFLQTKHRIIVLPECVKDYGDWSCGKVKMGDSYACAQCTPGCLVYQTVEQLTDSQTEIVLDPDDLEKFFINTKTELNDFGVVGVACALTLLSGFQVTQKQKLPTQGVFLNYSSCAHHWAKPAYNTSFSLKRMAEVLGKEIPSGEEPRFARGETYSMEKALLSPEQFHTLLDVLADRFEAEYLPHILAENQEMDIFDLALLISRMLVPKIITRDSV
jgi:hypothetical protein